MAPMDDLRAQVVSSYDALSLPSWPDPHPGMVSPAEDEYSRVTEPERYGIVAARASAWSQTLGALRGIRTDCLPPAPLDESGYFGLFDRGVRLTADVPGTLALLLLERDVSTTRGAAPMTVLHIGVQRPEVTLEMLPDCGCDACDSGSVDLLEAVDDAISHVIGGPTVVLRGRGWHADWHPEGGSSGGEGHGPDHTRTMEWCRRLAAGESVRLPAGTEACVGAAWFT